ncbi:AmpG family muropeptide MFS transporter [Oxalobacter vibrioformis]|uniref:AmpG family muropeptide MFS transporter n=1 Tax=Oxalobacter vibrioformis TaxID=933080 RepID=A0A9E9LWQ8_9BURK|nr:AmpG family muropeptide MFS transporter [Oxalobacter vibrioformis]WAW11165.1 AmpG family muropeptide MFS transporter [Oxalobacter vibrioformis]
MTTPERKFFSAFHQRMLICVFIGFSSGLPLFILLNLLQAWLAKSGLNVKSLGLFALVMFPYTWKFIWAPLMDRFSLGKMGRRRGWMAITQLGLFFSIGMMGMLDPMKHLLLIGLLCTFVAFLSSSQDIALDAYRRELLPDNEQGLGSAIHVNAYRVAGMVPGALSLILADMMSWQWVFWITAAFMIPGFICSLLIREPEIYGVPPANLREAVVLPFREFVTRAGWKNAFFILSFIFLYKLGDSLATALATKFYLDLGFSMTQIGAIAKTTGFWASLIGGMLGGIWMIRLGINRALWLYGVVQAVSILGFSWIASQGANPYILAFVIGFEALGVGLGTAAFVAYIARTTDKRYSATQYALFTSLAAIPRTFINASAGFIVDQTGWFMFFNICFVLALPGMMMLPKIAPWNGNK